MALCPGEVGPTQTRLNSDKGGKDMKFGEERLERLKKYTCSGEYYQNKFCEIRSKLIKIKTFKSL